MVDGDKKWLLPLTMLGLPLFSVSPSFLWFLQRPSGHCDEGISSITALECLRANHLWDYDFFTTAGRRLYAALFKLFGVQGVDPGGHADSDSVLIAWLNIVISRQVIS